tara:strand:- start:514 stop:750 length:237 start_codon:yes stop_codon:yes gene_type:complete
METPRNTSGHFCPLRIFTIDLKTRQNSWGVFNPLQSTSEHFKTRQNSWGVFGSNTFWKIDLENLIFSSHAFDPTRFGK